MSRALVYPFGISIGVALISFLVLTLSGKGAITIDPAVFCISVGVFLFFGMLIVVQIGIKVSGDEFDKEIEEIKKIYKK